MTTPPKPPKRSNAQALSESRAEHRRILAPLRNALRPILDKMSYDQASRVIGIPAWRIRRILSANASSPSYVDMTELIVAAGFTPNQGAQLAGLYTPPKASASDHAITLDDSSDPRLVYVVRYMTGQEEDVPADSRESLLSHMLSMIEGDKTIHEMTRRSGSVTRRVRTTR